ncbi:MAG: hypothetical protein KC680_02990 [Candidatus Peregrinibacteria bacterium]|nr:hypothetical protein [Candidatus Peregrinibacteria bacterium]MCB9808021.1 hypothetical protein [Candidatus Peribacteria bacterium]
MVNYLKQLSGFLFYLLGGSFFLAYLLMVNQMTPIGGWWLKVADLPLAFVGLLYGASSLYLSVKPKDRESRALFYTIGIPAVAIFSTLLVLNFWPALSLVSG